MPYGRAILAGFIILGHWLFVRSSPVDKGVNESERETNKLGGDLRSLHFPSEYHATGVLSLPTSNINEPFEVWHSQTYDKSRIDYYHGKSNTFTSHRLIHTLDQEIKSSSKNKKFSHRIVSLTAWYFFFQFWVKDRRYQQKSQKHSKIKCCSASIIK